MKARSFAVLLAASLPLAVHAEDRYPTRGGDVGLLDVPSASALGSRSGLLGLELRFDQPKGEPADSGPFPLSIVAGLTDRIDLGFSMREWGQPGDPVPTEMTYTAAGKLQLALPEGRVPALALGLVLDRITTRPVAGARLIASADLSPHVELAAYLGAEAEAKGGHDAGVTWGAALAFPVAGRASGVLEGFGGPRGDDVGAALRWSFRPTLAAHLAFNYLTKEQGYLVSVGITLRSPQQRPAPAVAEPVAAPSAPEVQPSRFAEDRPHFRMRMTLVPNSLGEARPTQYGARAAVAVAAPAAPGARPAAPQLEDLAEAQLRELESLTDTRERRVRNTAEQLSDREKAALAEAARLADREKQLTEREKQLDEREQRIGAKGAPSKPQRQLETLEAQLAAQERTIEAQERTAATEIDAAAGREKATVATEAKERREMEQLAAAAPAPDRARQIEARRQLLAARNRTLAAGEARLVAQTERLEALERQLRARSQRLDTWSRRLDTRAERLALLEQRSADAAAAPAPEPRPVPKDKPVFVTVVKSPTAIVKEAPGTGAAAMPVAAGTAVEKAVAAATLVAFPSPAATISELDGEAIDNVAKLAAREHCEVLIWARAKDPTLLGEAQRRAADLKARVLAAGPLTDKQVVTRTTTRPGAPGVDVVVSALREVAPPAPAATAGGGAALEAGEAGKKQIRDALLKAQPSIESCVGAQLERTALSRAEGQLQVVVAASGRVVKVVPGGADFATAEFGACISRAAAGWEFPSSDAEYRIEVPLTVVRGGAR